MTQSQHLSVSLSTTSLSIKSAVHKSTHDIPFRDILSTVTHENANVAKVIYVKKSQGSKSTVAEVQGTVHETHFKEASQCLGKALEQAYSVNPFGGKVREFALRGALINNTVRQYLQGKARAIFMQKVEPILMHAGCSLDVVYTTHGGHAYEIAKTLPIDDYDAVVTVSGDGLVHEGKPMTSHSKDQVDSRKLVLNGLAHHDAPLKALSIPIAPIPTGSGNGTSINLLGLDSGLDVAQAALNAAKGSPMTIDLFSFVQNGKRSISFMSQSLGLMADLDIGTEHLRWMGDSRFIYGLLRGVMQLKPCPVQLSVKIAEKDKKAMAESLQARKRGHFNSSDSPSHPHHPSLPPLKFLPEDEDGWTTIDEPLLWVYAGKGPYVSRDFMAFPVSLPDDGFIDVMVQPMTSRVDILKEMDGAPRGEAFWSPSVKYFKAHAYRVKTLAPKGSLSVDGEAFPFKEYQVEVHKGLGNLLSPHGTYAADFGGPPKRHKQKA
ncbi:hypothetical protein ONZ45_g17802 [Pleurotus djamor]|nr:hypothetical protein ONZ45_g17802 [Pleurotus djamor]